MVAVRLGAMPLILHKKAHFAQVIAIDGRADAVLVVGFVVRRDKPA